MLQVVHLHVKRSAFDSIIRIVYTDIGDLSGSTSSDNEHQTAIWWNAIVGDIILIYIEIVAVYYNSLMLRLEIEQMKIRSLSRDFHRETPWQCPIFTLQISASAARVAVNVRAVTQLSLYLRPYICHNFPLTNRNFELFPLSSNRNLLVF